MRYTYGFEEIALVPSDITINPDQTDISLAIDRLTFSISPFPSPSWHQLWTA
jgi:IMP dehydrogenase